MPRRQRREEHVNHERWLVSYADFITLLFAFFVVMYSVSSVNEGKYRVLSESLNAAFKQSATSLDPVQVGVVSRTAYTKYKAKSTLPIVVEFEGLPPPLQYKPAPKPKPEPVAKPGEPEQPMKELREQLNKVISPLINKDQVQVRGNNLELEIEINSSLLFASGGATLNQAALPLLVQLAKIIKPLANNVHVEGFTDNIPINNSIFPSNWELSTARAASVVQMLVEYGVDPRQLAATGYAEYHPIADNRTEEGRRKNRRVVLSIKASKYDSGVMDAISGFDIPVGLRSPGSRTILADPIYNEIQETRITPARDRAPENEQESSTIITPSRDTNFEPIREPLIRSAPVTTVPATRGIPTPSRTLPSDELPVKSGSFSSNIAPENLPTQEGKPYTLNNELIKQPVVPDTQGGQIQETP